MTFAHLSMLVQREDEKDPKDKDERRGLAPFIVFLIVIGFFCLCGVALWIIGTHLRARRLGLPPPTLGSYFSRGGASSNARNYPTGSKGGVMGWISDKFNAVKNRRTAGGAYEEPLGGYGGGSGAGGGRRSNRGLGALDPDEAWDTRVGTEADNYGPGGYYEEQELGLHGGGGYGGQTSGTAGATLPSYGDDDAPRGRSRSREPQAFIGGSPGGLDDRYDEEMGGKPAAANPFGDQAESSNMSLRGVSPRPMDSEGHQQQQQQQQGGKDISPTERRSMFRENMS